TKDTLVTAEGSVKADSTMAEPTKKLSHKFVASYFHGDRRCSTCRKIEAYSEEAVTGGFGPQLKDGLLEWRVLNTDEDDNKHYLTDYELYTKSLIISEVEDGKEIRWKNLPKIWELVNNKDEFIGYVRAEIKAYLEEK
ncbi:MAG: nitrophenyl compound nitroreductase subunit ArsF family protein, partial [Candidatus Zixiibacteriota bacterium]